MGTITKSVNVGKAKKGNTVKHDSYAEAFHRIKVAQEKNFFFEAIAIEESIICDRLYSYFKFKGSKPQKDIERITLGYFVNQSNKQKSLSIIGDILFFKIADFWQGRNTALHQICKSEPGTPTDSIQEFLKQSKKTAIIGEELARDVIKLTTHKKLL